jgi:cobalt-zinc-cadmium resistance protein CzcA
LHNLNYKVGSKKAKEEQKREQFVNQKKNELAKYQEAINYYNQYGKII